jgi:hypothetical protein
MLHREFEFNQSCTFSKSRSIALALNESFIDFMFLGTNTANDVRALVLDWYNKKRINGS